MSTGADAPAPGWTIRIEQVVLIVALGLLVYSVADWRGLFPESPGYRPVRMVFLSAALALQPSASLLLHKSRKLSYALLAASMIALAAAVVAG